MILGFHRFRCPVAQGLVQAFRVPPRHPPERRQFQPIQTTKRLAPPYQFGLVRAVDGFGHGVVVGVADRAGRGQHPVFHHPGGVDEADVLRPVVAVVYEPVGAAVRRGPGDRLLQRPQRQLLRVHGGGARPAHDPAGEHVGDERGIREASVRHAHVRDVGDVQPVRRRRLELPIHQIRPAARALGRSGRHRGFAAAHALDSRFAHDVQHLVAADLGRIPALGDQLGVHLPVSVHGHEEIRVDPEDVARQRLMPRPHAADGTCFEHAVAARREKTAVQ